MLISTNTSSIRNVKIKASNDTEWAVVEVDLNTRHEETYSRNSGYTAVSFNLKIPSVLNDCTHNFENPTPTLKHGRGLHQPQFHKE